MNLQPFLIFYCEWVSANIDLLSACALASVVLRVGIIWIGALAGRDPRRIYSLTHILVQFVPIVGKVYLLWQFAILLGMVVESLLMQRKGEQ